MATELGQAYVQIIPSARGIGGSIQKQLDPEATSAGTSAGSKIGSSLKIAAVAAVAAAGVVIGKTVSAAISEGANLEQSLGGVETLFKSSADKVKKYADEAYRTSGLSANAYMENVTGFSASLLQSLGGDTDKAADVANMAMIDMSDNANKMGTDMQDIQNAYQGFAKQNYTMLDNLKLGYGGTKSEMERLLADAQKLSGVQYDINNLSDVYNAIHAVQEELDITGTTAKEAAETLSGSLAAMKSSWSNVLGKIAIGENIDNELKALAQTTSTFLFGNFIPMLGNILKALPGALLTFIKEAVPYIVEAGSQFMSQFSGGITDGFPNLLTNFQSTIMGIFTWLTENLPMFLQQGVAILTSIANGILQAIPQIITTAGNILTTFVTFVMTNLPLILESGKNLLFSLVDGIISNLPAIGASAIEAISKFIDTVLENYPTYLRAGWNILLSLVAGILERLPDLINAAVSLMVKFTGMLISKIPSIISAGVEILLGLISGILKSIPDLLIAVGKIGTTILDSVGDINLLDAGKAIISGFVKGLQDAWETGKEFIGGIGDWIAKNKGPISYDKKLLIPAGKAIMGGLNEGLINEFKLVQKNVSTMADTLAKSFVDMPVATSIIDDELATFKTKSIGPAMLSDVKGKELINEEQFNQRTSERKNSDVINITLQMLGDLSETQAMALAKRLVYAIEKVRADDELARGGI
ncbi:PblA [Vagococcus fluvialis]|uniref:phage tail protein n=1 Tax=Vagococcus fluvialis TaxID=2738 RepID=UPI001A8DB7D6|nr:PblA [Vagococcus fluvialis]MBO0478721.1 PblA [Vagococcus fluvialis]MBO0484434.1 PblA [Vagococcus fluvialis]